MLIPTLLFLTECSFFLPKAFIIYIFKFSSFLTISSFPTPCSNVETQMFRKKWVVLYTSTSSHPTSAGGYDTVILISPTLLLETPLEEITTSPHNCVLSELISLWYLTLMTTPFLKHFPLWFQRCHCLSYVLLL